MQKQVKELTIYIRQTDRSKPMANEECLLFLMRTTKTEEDIKFRSCKLMKQKQLQTTLFIRK